MNQLSRRVYYIVPTVTACCVLVAPCANALEPAAYDVGPVQLIPQLNVEYGYDDNIYSVESNETDSLITILNPSLQAVLQRGLNVYSLNYAIRKGMYSHDSGDNYTDHDLNAQALLDFNVRNRMELGAGYLKTHEDRGTGLNQGVNATANASPIEYHVSSLSTRYTYGAEEAKGRLVVSVELNDREYDNYRNVTRGKDRTNETITGTFYYRLLPKTSLLFEVSRDSIDYDLASVTLDSTETEYLLGATWEATAKTTGVLKLGYAQKNFDSDTRTDDEGFSWEAAVTWAPKTYSTVTLLTSREEEETDGTGNFIDSTNWNLNWKHDWSQSVASRLSYGLSEDDYVAGGRSDDITTFGFGADYRMRRWLDFKLDYRYTERDSNQAGLDYDKNVVFLTVRASL